MSTATEAPVSHPVADLDEDSLLGSFPEGPRLIGSHCDDCGCTMIGSRVVCSTCVGQAISRVALPGGGVLYTFTTIHTGPAPRTLGYVDLDNGVRTLADITAGDIQLYPDIRVELGVEGSDWFFSPVEGEQGKGHHE
ncbi:Zn-ribbon domain-containing OB-fold protein [Arthrobacter sunyaminii]|uniref:OB-fold domain-containing protein n=1 Tax=Arthrobacter sunyaminii TaxID=2816859 RepID=A0A975XL48_9MICC|nr:OB-fold domain-containing protein [Arthrobacter sunyaminii]MBO0909818.1 OB-fold domain-containing protein [Arthrobacter sunyaminii]QWQ36608.1 OB-fold domain-containing protein [Arthrobacter sunyaminii]